MWEVIIFWSEILHISKIFMRSVNVRNMPLIHLAYCPVKISSHILEMMVWGAEFPFHGLCFATSGVCSFDLLLVLHSQAVFHGSASSELSEITIYLTWSPVFFSFFFFGSLFSTLDVYIIYLSRLLLISTVSWLSFSFSSAFKNLPMYMSVRVYVTTSFWQFQFENSLNLNCRIQASRLISHFLS